MTIHHFQKLPLKNGLHYISPILFGAQGATTPYLLQSHASQKPCPSLALRIPQESCQQVAFQGLLSPSGLHLPYSSLSNRYLAGSLLSPFWVEQFSSFYSWRGEYSSCHPYTFSCSCWPTEVYHQKDLSICFPFPFIHFQRGCPRFIPSPIPPPLCFSSSSNIKGSNNSKAIEELQEQLRLWLAICSD